MWDEMQIWSKDERPVRFQVIARDGELLAAVEGIWLEVIPMEYDPRDQAPKPGRAHYSLSGAIPEESEERIRDYVAFNGAVTGYTFQFAGRTFQGRAATSVTGSRLELSCMGDPAPVEQLKAS